jgi:ferric-dicitrate binding protein FerR (iron transport regulator)
MKRTKNQNFDFFHDEEFIRWVRKPTAESDAFWHAWMEAHPDWKVELLKARELLLMIHFPHKTAPPVSRQNILENIIQYKSAPRRTIAPTPKAHWAGKVMRIAAGLALIATLGLLMYRLAAEQQQAAQQAIVEETVIKESGRGMKKLVVLPDGSRVWLNADSRLTYTNAFGVRHRHIVLEGEAFFEVKRNEALRFVVQSGHLHTTALGTAFNVRAFANEEVVSVSLLSGQVEVTDRREGDAAALLKPGERLTQSNVDKTMHIGAFDYKRVVAWKDNVLYFEKAGFAEVRSRLEQWYGVSVVASADFGKNWNYSGEFKDQSLQRVLERMAFTQDFDFSIDKDKVTILNN